MKYGYQFLSRLITDVIVCVPFDCCTACKNDLSIITEVSWSENNAANILYYMDRCLMNKSIKCNHHVLSTSTYIEYI